MNQYLQLRLHQEDAEGDHSISSPLIQLENTTDVHGTHAL